MAHAYCFVGPNGVGKRAAARYLAAKLLKVKEEALNSHPDFYHAGRSEEEKTGKLKKDISIDQVRELSARLQNKPWLGGYQAAILEDAELLSASAGNALLKILEEPAAKSALFLIATDDGELLPTIRSRCQLIYFHMVETDKIAEALKKEGCPAKIAEEAAEAS